MIKLSIFLFINFFSAYWLNHTIIHQKTIKKPSNLTGLIYFILALPLINVSNGPVLILTLCLLSILYSEIIKLNNTYEIKKITLKVGFFLGCLCIINMWFLLFYPMVLLSLIYYQQFNWRHFTIQLISTMYPIGIFYVLSFFFKYPFMQLAQKYSISKSNYDLIYNSPILIGVLIILSALAVRELYYNIYKKTEHSKKAFNILFFLFGAIIMLITFTKELYFLHLLVLPISIIVSNYLIYNKYKKFGTFLLGLLIITFVLKFLYP